MKKALISFGLLIVILVGLIYCCNADWFSADMVSYGNLYYSLHKYANVCRVEYGEWNDTENSLEIEIPDEVDGHCVTIWGNNYPDPFVINIDGTSSVWSAEAIPEDSRIIPLYLMIHVGDNLKEIRAIALKDFYQDENDPQVFYQILVTVDCSQDNPNYYSENGKMYNKSNGALIDAFYYEADFRQ